MLYRNIKETNQKLKKENKSTDKRHKTSKLGCHALTAGVVPKTDGQVTDCHILTVEIDVLADNLCNMSNIFSPKQHSCHTG